uniref:Uncharacterized protein n=1 Tax=Mus spicilegus TaxID=10103 RepID=A0A8C6I7C5_MUSSI
MPGGTEQRSHKVKALCQCAAYLHLQRILKANVSTSQGNDSVSSASLRHPCLFASTAGSHTTGTFFETKLEEIRPDRTVSPAIDSARTSLQNLLGSCKASSCLKNSGQF